MTFDTRWRLVELIFLEKQGTNIWIIYRRTHFRGSSIKDVGNWKGVGVINWLKGDTDKQALKLICLQFLQFLSNFNETLSISLFFRGRLNRALRSDLTPLHSAHFTTAQLALCTNFPTLLFFKVESWFFVCGIELRFNNILRHYFLTYRVRTVHILHCTARTLHQFSNFFVYQGRELIYFCVWLN